MIVFETERLIVRQYTVSDADDFFRFNSHPEVMRYIRPVKTRSESDAFLQENLNLYHHESPLGRWMVTTKSDDVFIGTFSLLYLSEEEGYHLGYALMPEAQGKGYATELLKTGVVHFFLQYPDQTAVYAITEPPNTSSIKVLERVGFNLLREITQNGTLLSVYQFKKPQ